MSRPITAGTSAKLGARRHMHTLTMHTTCTRVLRPEVEGWGAKSCMGSLARTWGRQALGLIAEPWVEAERRLTQLPALLHDERSMALYLLLQGNERAKGSIGSQVGPEDSVRQNSCAVRQQCKPN